MLYVYVMFPIAGVWAKLKGRRKQKRTLLMLVVATLRLGCDLAQTSILNVHAVSKFNDTLHADQLQSGRNKKDVGTYTILKRSAQKLSFYAIKVCTSHIWCTHPLTTPTHCRRSNNGSCSCRRWQSRVSTRYIIVVTKGTSSWFNAASEAPGRAGTRPALATKKCVGKTNSTVCRVATYLVCGVITSWIPSKTLITTTCKRRCTKCIGGRPTTRGVLTSRTVMPGTVWGCWHGVCGGAGTG